MPELPEVETIVKALKPEIVNIEISDVRTYVGKLRYPLDLEQRQKEFCGYRIRDIRRRARYIIIEFSDLQVLVIHLGMTGALRISQQTQERLKHDHVIFRLSDGRQLIYSDIRRFGWIFISSLQRPSQDPPELSELGPEPLSRKFSGDTLYRQTATSARNIKTLIMDNRVVVGVGNIYANEALFFTGIYPLTTARDLSRNQCLELVGNIKKVLRKAIKAGGTTIQDFKGLSGEEGHFQFNLYVYGRHGEICRKCGGQHIEKISISGRSSFFCPVCQIAPETKK